jgi:RNase P subunit RPR2
MARLGPNPVCARCGHSDPVALVPGSRTTQQESHPGGRQSDPKLRVTLCRNCLAVLTEPSGKARARVEPNAACALCGYSDPAALRAVNRSTLEEHHPGGQKNDPEWTVTLCRNCHARLTDLNLRYGVSMKEPCDDLEQVQNRVRGMGVILADASVQLDECSTLIEQHRKDCHDEPSIPESRSPSVHNKKQKKAKGGGRRAAGAKRSKTKKRTRVRRRDDD